MAQEKLVKVSLTLLFVCSLWMETRLKEPLQVRCTSQPIFIWILFFSWTLIQILHAIVIIASAWNSFSTWLDLKILLPSRLLALLHVRDSGIFSQLIVFFFHLTETEKNVLIYFKVMLILLKRKLAFYFILCLC